MPKKKISFLAIPPKHERVRYVRIRFGVIVFVLIIFLGGITGFFIPFNSLSLDVVELNQKKQLTDQNRKLLIKIRNMREKFFILKSKVDTLTQTKENIEHLIGIDTPVALEGPAKKQAFNEMELDEFLK